MDAGTAPTVEWPADTQAGNGNGGVAQIITDTEGRDRLRRPQRRQRPAASPSPRSRTRPASSSSPTLEATTAAAEGVTVNDDLTFFAGWADGDDGLPDHRPDLDHRLHHADRPGEGRGAQAFLTYLLTDGQDPGAELDYAPLPGDLDDKALRSLDIEPRSGA